jgi:hypothetical protein
VESPLYFCHPNGYLKDGILYILYTLYYPDAEVAGLFLDKERVAPSIVITIPNGGEIYHSGEVVNITWQANDNVGIAKVDSILYSTNGGNSWLEIASNLPGNTTSYEWTIPSTPSENCKVRVVVSDGAGNKARDESDGVFAIRYFVASGFEEADPVCIEHQRIFGQGVVNDDAYRSQTEEGISPHSGEWMYKLTGTDNNSSGTNDYVWYKLFDYDIPIIDSTYLSFWIYVKESPGNLGHILIDGGTKHGVELRNWVRFGYILDQTGQRLHPAVHTIPQGQWLRYVFTLYPAKGDTIDYLMIGYDDGN